jgi:transposase
MLARAASPFAVAGQAIAAEVRAAPVIASDETSARVQGKTHWQWVFGCATAVVHIIAPSRGKAVVTSFLAGARPAVWISDRLAAQYGHAGQHQFCLAHLIRDAQYAIDDGDTVFAPGFKGLLKRACAIGRRRSGLADAKLRAYRRDLDRRLDRLLATDPNGKAGLKLKWVILACRQNLFVFVTRRDVPATNNVSERALRPSVIFQKVTNGFRSTWGAEVYADIRSIVATGQLNDRSALTAIRQTLAAGATAVV